MGGTVSTDEELIATSRESLESVADTSSKEVFKVSGFFASEPEDGYPTIEGFVNTPFYLLDEVSGYRYNIVKKPEEENIYYYIVRLFTDRKLDLEVRERLEEEKLASEQFPMFLQRLEFHNVVLKFDVEKKAALFKVGSDEGNSFMSLFGMNGGNLTYFKRVRLVSSAILNIVKLFELSEKKYCIYPIDISHIAIQENLNVRFFDCLHTIADKNDKESIFNLGLKTICKIGACILTSNEALYDKDLFYDEWLSDPNIPIPVFSTLFKKALSDNNGFTLDNIRNELNILEFLTMMSPIKQSCMNILTVDNFKDLVDLYASLLPHHQSDPFHDPLIHYLTQAISTASQQDKKYRDIILNRNKNSFVCTLLLNSIFKKDLTITATNISDQIKAFSNLFKDMYTEKEELTEMISQALIDSRKSLRNDLGVSRIILDTKLFIESVYSANKLTISEEELDTVSRLIFK